MSATVDHSTTYCTLIRITRTDTTVFGLTDHDVDISEGGVDYVSASGYTPTAYATDGSLGINNADISGLFDAAGIDKADAAAGLFDNAAIDIWVYDYEAETILRQLSKGWWGAVKLYRNTYTAEFRSISQSFTNTVGRTFAANCDAQFADSRCGLTPATYTSTGTITAVSDNSSFADSALTDADNTYRYGSITFTSGDNNGVSMEVKTSLAVGAITTFQPLPFDVEVGDTFSIVQGCDKFQATCNTTYSNVDNFRGFPDIPNSDEAIKIHGT